MTAKTRTRSGIGFSARLSALAIGTALIALPTAGLAQQEEHPRDGNGGRNGAAHQDQARPAPAFVAPRAAPAPVVREANPRGVELWDAQARAARANEANGGQARQTQQNFTPAQPAYPRGRAYQAQPGNPDQPRGEGAWRGDRGQWRQNGGGGRNDGQQWRQNGGGGRNDGQQWRQDGGAGRAEGGQWRPAWRQDNRYDWRGWRDENRDAFHAGRYYAPYRGYSYNRLGIGFYLQPLFFDSDYWIADPWYYRLPPAYGPYHWVRYYNDVLLVNTYTGQVADVIYDFFW